MNYLENALSYNEGSISHPQLSAVTIYIFFHCIMFANDFVSCLFLIITLSYYSNYKKMTLSKTFPEHSSYAHWKCE